MLLFCMYLSIICFTFFHFSLYHFSHTDGCLFSLSPALVRNFPSCNVFPQSRRDDYISPSLLLSTSMLLAGATLLRTYHRPHSFLYNPVLGFPTPKSTVPLLNWLVQFGTKCKFNLFCCKICA